jgi:glycosyltransferase involved in cell wall biosynthesis
VRGTIKKLLKYPLIKVQIKYALRKSVRVFTVCNDLKKTVATLEIPEEKIIVVPNGVDIEHFRPVEKVNLRKELGLPKDRKIMISVGGLVERKGFHRIISALPNIKKVIPNAMYLIVGGNSLEGNYESMLRKMIEKLDLKNDVFFAGIQPHNKLYKWLSASDIFCLATTNEGWANVFLEAMACGLPVVTSRVGGNEEVVSTEDYGLLFQLEDKKGMSESIIKAFQTNWKKEKIINYAQLNTWDKTADKLIIQFEQITGCNSTVSSTQKVVL